LILLGLSLLFSIALCVHAVRSGQASYWLLIILLLQPLGGIVYFIVNVAPEWLGGPTARRVGQEARARLDPDREYREARAAVDDAPTVRNQMRLAEAAADMGRHEEAEALYGAAAVGVHADDPALIHGRARALVELNRPAEALPLLERAGELGDAGRTPEAALAMARAYEALGRMAEAEDAYAWAAERMPGLEAIARHAAFMAATGRRAEAEATLTEIDRRVSKTGPHFRKEARGWRDYAAERVRA
jgi:hypothetical protein